MSHGREWTAERDLALAALYLSVPRDWPGWAEALPGSTVASRCGRASALGMSKKRLRADAGAMSRLLSAVSERTGRTRVAIAAELLAVAVAEMHGE